MSRDRKLLKVTNFYIFRNSEIFQQRKYSISINCSIVRETTKIKKKIMLIRLNNFKFHPENANSSFIPLYFTLN